jgi:hypothetical protein
MRRYDTWIYLDRQSDGSSFELNNPIPLNAGWVDAEDVTVLPRAVADALVAVAEAARKQVRCYHGNGYENGCVYCDEAIALDEALARLDAANAGGGM